jgi:FkbM family methyltransferase
MYAVDRRRRLKWHDHGKSLINAVARRLGTRVVNVNWGPRGMRDTLQRAKARGFSPELIFDIGASNGIWTRECRSIYGEARYVLVDPLEGNRDALLAMASSDKRITAWCGATGAQAGTLELYEHGDQSSFLYSEDFPGARRTVEVTTADFIWESQKCVAPVLLKADVQGYELEVLRGATRCLEATEMLILEVSFRRLYKEGALAHEIIAYVAERGFRIYDLCSYVQRASDLDLIQSDLVFVKESSSLFGYQGWK